jgi:hypothetical protein
LSEGPGFLGLHPLQALEAVYGEESLAGREAALWLAAKSLRPWSTLGNRFPALRGAGRGRHRGAQVGGATAALRDLARVRSSAAAAVRALDSLGEGGWLKALRLDGYAPRAPRGPPQALQEALFPFAEAL